MTALSILEAANAGVKALDAEKSRGGLFNNKYLHPIHIFNTELGAGELSVLLTPFDLKRLESYANNMLDYHVILDLLPTVASLYFEKRLGGEIRLSAVQSSILLALGAQRKTIEQVEVNHSSSVSYRRRI